MAVLNESHRNTCGRQTVLHAIVSIRCGSYSLTTEITDCFHSWTRPQVQARAHPNVLSTTVWLNNLYHVSDSGSTSPEILKDVDLNVPLAYADRFRIRHPGVQWDAHPPHIDGGGIERWEEPHFRSCFESILKGDWENHDPYDLTGRLNAKTSLYGRPNQVCRI